MSPKVPSRPLSADDIGMTEPNRSRNTNQQNNNRNTKPKPTSQNRQAHHANRTDNKRPPAAGQGASKNKERRGMPPPKRLRDRGGKRTMVEGSFNTSVSQVGAASKVTVAKADAGVLKIIPLGGLSHIGKNMMALEYEDDIIVVDMGFMFPRADMPGVDYVIPDTTYLEERKHKIRAILITHAHEDHVGGIPFMLPKLNAPIYGARFTIAFIQKKLEEYNLNISPQYRVVDPDKHERIRLGAFTIEFLRVVHAIPDPCAIAIDTPVGRIIHTGDWRFDDTPVDNKLADKKRLKELGDEGVLMLLSDSTSCEVLGRSTTEADIEKTFEDLFSRHQKSRIIVSTFSSQINRVQIIVDAAKKYNRKIAFVGRSMLSNIELAVKLGYIKLPPGMVVRVQDAAKMPDGQQVIVSTGNQGEENSALVRMATGAHKDVRLKKGDVIAMSSSIIPGNEVQVYTAVDDLMREGALVYQDRHRDLYDLGRMHISGHAYRDELVEMIKLTRPKYFVPIHGEFHHLVWHAQLAKTVPGYTDQNVFVIEDGQTLEARKDGTVKLGKQVPAGMVLIDGNGVGDVQQVVLRDRLAMGTEGMLVVIATVDKKNGKLLTSPDLISRGFIYMKDNEEVLTKSRKIIKNIFDTRDVSTPANSLIIKTRMRDELANYLFKVTKRSPIILPAVIEVW